MTTYARVLEALATLAGPDGDDYPTAREIAAHLGTSTSAVSGALRRAETIGKVRKIGVAFDGGATWTLVEGKD